MIAKPQKVTFVFYHPNFGDLKINTTIDANFSCDDLIELMSTKSAELAAQALVNEDRPPDWLMDLGLQEIGVGHESQAKRFAITGIYSSGAGDGGTWEDHVYAIDREESEFQAKFQMAVNELSHTERSPLLRELENLATTMDQINIVNNVPEPVTLDECKAALESLVRAASKAGLRGAEIDAANEILKLSRADA